MYVDHQASPITSDQPAAPSSLRFRVPFENQHSLAFTAVSVRKNAPPMSGVYGISSGREWIYVGQGDNILDELLQHLREPDSFMKSRHPTGFTFELCPPAGRTARQNSLVQELEPVSNRGLHELFRPGGQKTFRSGSL